MSSRSRPLAGAQEIGVAFAADSPCRRCSSRAPAGRVGRGLRERDQVAASLAERARELEEEREAHAALSVRYERARIAAELHDIVAHAISVMVVQAAAGQRSRTTRPRGARRSRRSPAPRARPRTTWASSPPCSATRSAIAAAPDLALVEQLVARAAGSGLAVTLRLEGEREGIPAPAAQAAYHVVQEGLTNALRYAAGAQVDVLVRGDRDALVVERRQRPRRERGRPWPASARAPACRDCASASAHAAARSRPARRTTAAGSSVSGCRAASPWPDAAQEPPASKTTSPGTAAAVRRGPRMSSAVATAAAVARTAPTHSASWRPST